MYLKIKEKTEYTGPEQYVSEMIRVRDLSFIPIQKALCLDVKEVQDEERTAQLMAQVEELSLYTKKFVNKMGKDLSSRLDELDRRIDDFDHTLYSFLHVRERGPSSSSPISRFGGNNTGIGYGMGMMRPGDLPLHPAPLPEMTSDTLFDRSNLNDINHTKKRAQF
eukprot:TRINITY_DN3992_c0_g1_i2.p1 TRINITY_DN3992_c0_g1~~TRINITY_DN3992_c0_g1_i2.p1  ORF type:complete len:165 (-),score=35.41 TRINITY_DN3992_c0_g1_i2:90-584(-)